MANVDIKVVITAKKTLTVSTGRTLISTDLYEIEDSVDESVVAGYITNMTPKTPTIFP